MEMMLFHIVFWPCLILSFGIIGLATGFILINRRSRRERAAADKGRYTCQVEAVQFWVEDRFEIYDWIGHRAIDCECNFDKDDDTMLLGGIVVDEGDWLVHMPEGCSIDVFGGATFRKLFRPAKGVK